MNNSDLSAFEKINLVRSFNDGRITGIQKLILFIITSHLGDNDFCFVSITTLCRECCLSRQCVIENIQELIIAGYLIRILPSDGYKSNRYKVNMELISSKEDLLVNHVDQTSQRHGLDQSTTLTRLVNHVDPNRNIKEIEKKSKRKRGARPFKRGLSKNEKQQIEDQNIYGQKNEEQHLRRKEEEIKFYEQNRQHGITQIGAILNMLGKKSKHIQQ